LGREYGKLVFNDFRVTFEMIERFWKRKVVMISKHCIYLMPLKYKLKNG
jgi:hypothetical protein